jgi:hypothetical protein
MKTTRRELLLTTAFLTLAAPLARAAKEPADVAGRWDITWRTRQGDRKLPVRFQQDGQELSGSLGGRRGGGQITGSVKGNKITFRIEMKTRRGDFALLFRGKVDGDTMGGNVAMGQMTSKWSAVRTR